MFAKVATAVLVATLCTGCIRSATVINVKADGSGTVEQTMLVNLALMKGMLGGMGPAQPAGGAAPSEADMKRTATRMGEGVTFVSAQPVKDEGFEGTKALYAFTDITKLRVDQDPNLNGAATGGISTPPKNDNPVTFQFVKGSDGVSTLTVSLKDKPAKAAGGANPAAPAGGPDFDNPQMLDMMRSMFKGFKVSIDLNVAGAIVKTNADYVSGSRITLLEMDMEQLLKDEAKLRAAQKALGPDASISELKPYLKDVQGLKMNDPVVTVAFK